MTDTYTIIEDIDDIDVGNGRNQLTAARGFLSNSHVPDDMRPQPGRRTVGKVSERPEFQELNPQSYLPMQNLQNQTVSPMIGALMNERSHMGVDGLACRDVFVHVENCPLCKSYFKHDAKFYWMIIAILIIVIFLMNKNSK